MNLFRAQELEMSDKESEKLQKWAEKEIGPENV